MTLNTRRPPDVSGNSESPGYSVKPEPSGWLPEPRVPVDSGNPGSSGLVRGPVFLRVTPGTRSPPFHSGNPKFLVTPGARSSCWLRVPGINRKTLSSRSHLEVSGFMDSPGTPCSRSHPLLSVPRVTRNSVFPESHGVLRLPSFTRTPPGSRSHPESSGFPESSEDSGFS